MAQHAASILAFLIPCVVALYMEKHVVSASMLILVATSIANHQFGVLMSLDRAYVRTIMLIYTLDALRKNAYSPALCSVLAGTIYLNRTCKMDHVLMHVIGCCRFVLYVLL